jgi:hypothetical protein
LFLQEIAMQDPKTPRLDLVLRVVKTQVPTRLYERCRREGRQRWIEAVKTADLHLQTQVRRQAWPGRLVTQARGGNRAWAGVTTPQAFVWLDAGPVDTVPGNESYFAAALDAALAQRRR